MSSLSWFRKNAKVLMVVFGIGAMVIFGLGGVVSMVNPGDLTRITGDDSDAVIARWKGGTFTRAEIRRFSDRHFQSQRFLGQLQQYAAKKKGDNFRSEAMPIRPIVEGGGFNEEEVDDRVVVRLLMADKAKTEGIVIDRAAVEDYLAMVCGSVPVSWGEMKELNKVANSKQVELEHLMRHLEKELAFQQMSVLTGTGITLAPNPTEAVQYYDRTHRTAECKVLPFKVSEYVDKVTEVPTEEKLREYYSQGKYEYADPTGKRPGFKVGKKVRAQYFVADYDTFLENEMNKLTDQEIQEEYDRLVAEGNDLVMEVVPTEVENEEKLPGLDQDAPKPPGDGSAQMKDDAAPAPPAAEEKAGDAEEKAGDAKEEKAGDAKEEKAGDAKEEKAGDQSSVAMKVGPQFVFLQEEAKQEESTSSGESAAQASTKGEEPKPVAPADAALQTDAAPEGAEILGPTMQDEPAIEKRAKPLKDVEDEVKRSLKAEQARNAVDKALSRAEAKIRVHQMNVSRWESSPNRKDSEKPDEMDEKAIKAIADEFNLQFNESPLVEYDEMREEPLGKIVTFVFGQDGRPITQNVSNMIFGRYHEIEPFEPSKVEDFATRSTYLYWLAEKVDQQVPTFEEAKSSVEKYWKQQKAIELARAEAKKVVESLGSTKSPMSETYTEAVDTGSFTWFTTLGDIRYSTPVGVDQPGQEFMKQVFSLDEMAAGVAANETQEVVYAIQVTKKDQKSVEELGSEYLDQQFFTFKRVPFDVSSLSNFYTQQVNFDWMDEFTEEMELEWVGR